MNSSNMIGAFKNVQSLDNITQLYDITMKRDHCVGDNDTLYPEAFLPTGYTFTSTVLLCVFVGCFCLYGFIGNCAVIFVIFTDRILSNHSHNMYLVSLALADALLCVLVIPFSLSHELMGTWLFGATYCKIYLAVDVMLCTASIWSICIIGLDRYWLISQPLSNRKKRTTKRIKMIIIFIWMFSCAICIPPIFVQSTRIPSINQNSCFINNDTWYIIFSTMSSFFIPAFIILPVYWNIYMIGKKHARGKVGDSLKSNSNVPLQSRQDGHFVHSMHSTKSEPCMMYNTRHTKQRSKTANGYNVIKHTIILDKMESDENENLKVLPPSASECPSHTSKLMYDTNTLSVPAGSFRHSICSCHHNNLPSHKKKSRMSTASFQFIRNVFIRKLSSPIQHVGARERRFTMIICVVMGCFILCWWPFFQTYVIYAICKEKCCINKTMFKAFFWLGYMNSGFNPAIYTIFNKEFRIAFRKLFNRLFFCC